MPPLTLQLDDASNSDVQQQFSPHLVLAAQPPLRLLSPVPDTAFHRVPQDDSAHSPWSILSVGENNVKSTSEPPPRHELEGGGPDATPLARIPFSSGGVGGGPFSLRRAPRR